MTKKKVKEHNVVATFYVDSCDESKNGRHTFVADGNKFYCSQCKKSLDQLKVTKG